METTLQSFPPATALIAALARVPYAEIARKTFHTVVTIVFVVAALTSLAVHAAREFWAEHGEEIVLNFEIAIERLEIAIERTYEAGRSARPVVDLWVNRAADYAFFRLASI